MESRKIWSRKLKVPQREVMAGKSAMVKNAEENQSDSVAENCMLLR